MSIGENCKDGLIGHNAIASLCRVALITCGESPDRFESEIFTFAKRNHYCKDLSFIEVSISNWARRVAAGIPDLTPG